MHVFTFQEEEGTATEAQRNLENKDQNVAQTLDSKTQGEMNLNGNRNTENRLVGAKGEGLGGMVWEVGIA